MFIVHCVSYAKFYIAISKPSHAQVLILLIIKLNSIDRDGVV